MSCFLTTARRLLLAMVAAGSAVTASAQTAPVQPGDMGGHRLYNGYMPPGQLGASRVATQSATLAGYVQPIRFNGPAGVQFGMTNGGAFDGGQSDLQIGLPVGSIHRFRITNIPRQEGVELYPTVEVIDRTYPPPGLKLKYPIRIDISTEDLLAAIDGQMVTRIVYLEDTATASALPQSAAPQQPFDAPVYQDPMHLADSLGRPVAILRIGSLLPPEQPELAAGFFFGYPTWFPIFAPEPLTPEPQTPDFVPEQGTLLESDSTASYTLTDQPVSR